MQEVYIILLRFLKIIYRVAHHIRSDWTIFLPLLESFEEEPFVLSYVVKCTIEETNKQKKQSKKQYTVDSQIVYHLAICHGFCLHLTLKHTGVCFYIYIYIYMYSWFVGNRPLNF